MHKNQIICMIEHHIPDLPVKWLNLNKMIQHIEGTHKKKKTNPITPQMPNKI